MKPSSDHRDLARHFEMSILVGGTRPQTPIGGLPPPEATFVGPAPPDPTSNGPDDPPRQLLPHSGKDPTGKGPDDAPSGPDCHTVAYFILNFWVAVPEYGGVVTKWPSNWSTGLV